jgi:outer membrane protein assembly factor BamB
VVVEVGHNKEGTIWAFDKGNGRVKWKSAHRGNRANASPTLITLAGKPCVPTMNDGTVLVVRMDPGHEGESLIEHPWRSSFNESNRSPIISGNKVLVTMASSFAALLQAAGDSAGAHGPPS